MLGILTQARVSCPEQEPSDPSSICQPNYEGRNLGEIAILRT